MTAFGRLMVLAAAVTGTVVLFGIRPEPETQVEQSRPSTLRAKQTSRFPPPDTNPWTLKKSNSPALVRKQYQPILTPSDIGFRQDLPLEYRGGEVLSAEEVIYENGLSELQCVMDVGLGQEKILLVEKSHSDGRQRHATVYSAERFNILPRPEYLSSLRAALQHLGLHVMENKYGALMLSIQIPEQSPDILRIRPLLEDLLQNQGELVLSPPLGRTIY